MTAHTPGETRLFVGGEVRTYRCAPDTHEVEVVGQDGRRLFTFGGLGSARGRLNEPTDIVEVRATLDSSYSRTPEPLLAVADRGNHRIQLFGLDGTAVTTIDPWQGRRRVVDAPADAGGPFFRLQPLPQMVLPWRLEWRAPFLQVETSRRTVVRIHLDRALLPDFRTWIEQAPASTLSEALDYFARPARRQHIPTEYLRSIAHRVGSVQGKAASR